MSMVRSVLRGGLASLMIALMGAHPANAFTLSIFHNNDGESDLLADANGFGGVDQFVNILNQQRAAAQAAGYGTLTLSSGDNFLAGLEFSAGQNAGTNFDALALEAINYDAVVLGNHDFDFGPDFLASFIGEVDNTTFLSANLDFSAEADLQALVDAGRIAKSTVVDVQGQQVGIVGATTPNLPTISSPGGVVVEQDVAAAVQAEIDALEAAGVDKIIFVSHLQGVADDTAVIAQLTGVDVAIAGGGDELLANDPSQVIPGQEGDIFGPYPLENIVDATGKEVPVVTTSGQYQYLGRLTVEFDDATGELVQVLAGDSGPIAISGPGDPTVQATITDPLEAALANVQVLATTDTDLDTRRNAIRSKETAAGNLIADSFLWQAGQDEFLNDSGLAGATIQDYVIAVQNGGGIRSDTLLGVDAATAEITDLYALDTLPFDNKLSLIESIDGNTLKTVLENAVARIALSATGEPVPEGSGTGRFAQIAGFSFEYDPTQTAIEIDIDGNITQSGERVLNVRLADGTYIVKDGVVLPDAPTVSVITNSFTAAGGDQYPWGNANVFDSSLTYVQPLINYLSADPSVTGNGLQGLGGFVSADQYPVGGEGRITLASADDSAAVPEPGTVLGLMALAGLGAGTRRRRRTA